MKNFKIKNFISLFLALLMFLTMFPVSVQAASNISALKITSARSSRNMIVVYWNKASSADGYQIQYSTNSKFKNKKTVSCSKNETSKKLTGLKYSKKYYIRIRTRKGKSYSKWVSTSRTTRSSKEAHTPMINNISPTQGGFIVKWPNVSKSNGYSVSASYYQYQYTTDIKFKKNIVTKTTNSYKITVTGLKADTKYFVRVRSARKLNGKTYYSPWSYKKNVVAWHKYRPDNISGFKVTPEAGAFIATAKISNASGWQIFYATNSSFKNGKTKNVSKSGEYMITGLGSTPTTYYVKVRAYKKVNGKTYYSPYSSAKTVKTKALVSPDTPAANSFSCTGKGCDYVTLAISETAANANKYKVIYSVNTDFSDSKEKIFSGTTCKITGLKENTKYFFKLYSVNETNGNISISSAGVTLLVTTLPDTRPVIATTSASNTSFVVTWNEVPGAASYTVVYGQKDSTHFYGFEKQEEVTTTSFKATDLYDGESYYFKVKANGIENALYRETTVDTKRKAINSGVTETKVSWDGYSWPCVFNKPAMCSPSLFKAYLSDKDGSKFNEYYMALNRIYRETGCADNMDDVTKYILITEWIYCNVDYADNSDVQVTSYHSVFDGKSTCAGYAALFVDLCYLANIPAYYVSTNPNNSGSFHHTYAVFKLNGYWYIGNSQNGMGFADFMSCDGPFEEWSWNYMIENNEGGFGRLMYINGINKYWVHMAQPYKNMVTNQCKPYGTVNTHKATDQAFWDAAKYAYITPMVGRYKDNVNIAKNIGYNIVLKTEYKY